MPTFTVYKGSSSGEIVKSQTTRPSLTGSQVLVKVTASGVCGTDEHYRTTDMGLGHEGAGIVDSIGPSVRYLQVGDHVGWGYEHDNCGMCRMCLSGRDNYCYERAMYGGADLDQGSFASAGVWKEEWLFKIPEGMSDRDAAPLMCGGATVFNALRNPSYDVKPTDRVGIIGVGGLGHLAIQFASKMGCEVVVFSGTDSKREEATKLGARVFIASKGKGAEELQKELGKKLDVLMVTTSHQPDWNVMIPLMQPDSTIFPISVADGNLTMPYDPFLQAGLRVQASVVAPKGVHKQMIEFAAVHEIKPMINEFPLTKEGITDAMETLKAGKMRYRAVLVPQE